MAGGLQLAVSLVCRRFRFTLEIVSEAFRDDHVERRRV